jgi:sporulation-control protein
MVFKKMLKALGVGGPSVDTVLHAPQCQPGGMLTGEVRLAGGDSDADIEHVALSLVTHVEHEERGRVPVEFHRIVISGRFHLHPNQQMSIPFQFPVPWETPITDVYGQRLHGMSLGLRTELAVAGAIDKGDLDPVFIQPLPAQEHVLDAFGRLGFRFSSADLEPGRIHGVRQELPFFQEIEFYPAQQYAGRINQVELTFVANPHGMEIVLEADKRGGLFHSGGDVIGRFGVSHEEAFRTDWARVVDDWVQQVASRRGSHHGHGGGHHGHHGSGIGGVVAGAAAGVVGGMILGEVFDEVGDALFGDED